MIEYFMDWLKFGLNYNYNLIFFTLYVNFDGGSWASIVN